MSEIRQRLEAHRNDALVLLGEVSKTARLREGFRLAGAVGHLAQAQVLLAEELNGFRGEPKEANDSASEPRDQDVTPLDGIRLKVKELDTRA